MVEVMVIMMVVDGDVGGDYDGSDGDDDSG